jgi:AbrB family looped-hinge helix DNA binding protein
MDTVTISPKYQVVIPKEIREKMHLTVGEKVQMVLYENRLELIPLLPMPKLRGFVKGIKTDVPRENDRS